MQSRILLSTLIGLLLARLFLAAVTPVFDPSEARYAAISANMARTGEFTVPMFTHKGVYRPFTGKPPLLFQAGGGCCRAFGVREFSVRMPVLLATGLLLVLMFQVVRKVSEARRALLACVLTLSCVAYFAQSGFCMTDGILSACIAAAYLCHFAFLTSARKAWALGVFAALALGMLAKGPVALVLFACPVLLDAWLNARWKVLRAYPWFVGIPLFLLIAAPWFLLMERRDPGFLRYFFIHENLLRFLVHDYGDRFGAGRETFRGMALVWAFVVTLPWGLVLPILLRPRLEKLKVWLLRLADGNPVNVFVCGVLGIVGFWCLTSRVPLPYLMPVVPLCAVFTALALPASVLARLSRLVPVAAVLTVFMTAAIITITRLATDKMQGPAAAYHPHRYAYEFYHGTPAFAREVRP